MSPASALAKGCGGRRWNGNPRVPKRTIEREHTHPRKRNTRERPDLARDALRRLRESGKQRDALKPQIMTKQRAYRSPNENKMSDGGRGRASLGVECGSHLKMWTRSGPPFAYMTGVDCSHRMVRLVHGLSGGSR